MWPPLKGIGPKVLSWAYSITPASRGLDNCAHTGDENGSCAALLFTVPCASGRPCPVPALARTAAHSWACPGVILRQSPHLQPSVASVTARTAATPPGLPRRRRLRQSAIYRQLHHRRGYSLQDTPLRQRVRGHVESHCQLARAIPRPPAPALSRGSEGTGKIAVPADPTRPPSAPGRHRRIRLSAVLLSVAVLLVACTSGSARSSGGSKVDLRTGTPARLALPDGASVEVPAGAVGSPGELTGRTTGAPAPAPTGTVLGSKVYDFTGPAPAAPVTVTLPVAPAVFSAATPAGAPPPSVAALAFFDAPSGSWQLVPARYDPAARTISAATPHLSLWTVLRVDTGRLAGLAGRALNNYLGAANVAQPDCPGDQQLRAVGVRVSSDSGDLVKWCAGSRDGRSLVRVANNRDYAMEVDYPPGWTATRLGDSDAVLDRIVAGLAGHMTAPLGGQQSLVLGGCLLYTSPS